MSIEQSIIDRRKWFAENLDRVSGEWIADEGMLFTCPCCGYPTLDERGGYDICCLCNWEDDGQDDPHADEIRGGPNKGYSLTQARTNFAEHLVMYPADDDPRIGGSDSVAERNSKRAIIEAFNGMRSAINDDDRNQLWNTVTDNQRILTNQTDRKTREYEAKFKEEN